jgi:hypothetical protein
VGARHHRDDNRFGLMTMDHVALPTKNIVLMDQFIREVLGGEPYYYAGFDSTDKELGRKPHIFLRVGRVLFQCTEEASPALPPKDNSNISPHWGVRRYRDGS